jgi:2,5-diketo-D-gluconate reductase A
MASAPDVTLNTGASMPQLGLGVWEVAPEDTITAVRTALDSGYRKIDTARIYDNEVEVGKAIAGSGIPREEVFVTTKLWNDDQGAESARRAFDDSLRRLGMDYVDLYLIHWPVPAQDRYVETWKTLEEIHADGRARAIGVSNFRVEDLQRLFDECEVVPALNQIELHPRLAQPELRAFHAERGILTEAYSPLASGGDVLRDPVITEIAERHGKNPGQAILRWHVQLGNVVIPRSINPERIAGNIDIFDFQLSDEEVARISALDAGERTGQDPAVFG